MKQQRVIPFGKYLLLQRIAVGGMAEVFLAKSFGIEGFEKIIAIKRILPTMAEDEDFIEMFIDEAKIAGHLSHANIVPIYELGKIGESHYIAMEYVWGKDLLQIMNRFRRMRKRMPPAMVGFIGSRMCEGFDYAHSKCDRKGNPLNLVHRDVSPQNILCSYEGAVKVIDFGIAKAASRTTKTQAGVLKGKFGYMSPEQVRGLPIDARSDIFAVGTVMYELITGERLFMGESDFSTLEKVRGADVPPPSAQVPGLPTAFDDVIMKALARDPADRYQTAGELQEAILEFLVTQRPPFTTSKLGQWMKTAFGKEIEAEKNQLDAFAQMGRPSVLGGGGGQRRDVLSQTADDHPVVHAPAAPPAVAAPPVVATRRPPKPVAPPPLARVPAPPPVVAAPAPEPELAAFGVQEDDFGGEATMITSSPFDEMMDSGGAPPAPAPGAGEVKAFENDFDDLQEEATQIFFSADDVEEISDAELIDEASLAVPIPASGSRPPPAGVVQLGGRPAGFTPQAAPAGLSPSAMPGPLPAPGPVPPLALGGPLAPQSTPIVSQPPAAVTGATVEMVRPVLVAPPSEEKRGKMMGMFAAAAALMLALGIGGAYLVFGGDSYGSVEIRTNPNVGASVSVDGEERGNAPLRIDRLPPGRRLVEISSDGHEDFARVIEVGENQVYTLDVDLRALAGVAAVASAPTETAPAPTPTADPSAPAAPAVEAVPAAPVEVPAPAPVAPAPVAVPTPTPAPTPTPTPTKRSTPMTQRPRMIERLPSMSASPMEASAMETMSRPRGRGTLVINTMPWARVFVDGRDTRQNTPVRNLRVRAGDHRIGLRTSDGTMHNVSVSVGAGETVRIVRRL